MCSYMKMNTRILTNWQPSKLDRETVRREFRRLLKKVLPSVKVSMTTHPGGDVREPPRHRERNTADDWHKDCGGVDLLITIWTNIKPTEVRFSDGSLLEAKDGDVILIDNLEVEHRTPEGSLEGRWFARARVAKGER